LHRGVLKLTAQLAPIERIRGAAVALETGGADGRWHVAATSAIDPLARIARFRIEDWRRREPTPYRVRLTLPLRDRSAEFFYAGTIDAEPAHADRLKVAVFSCNADHGFPDADVPTHVATHRPDMAVFLGDQYYERTGGFRIQTEPLDQAVLDCLHKWYMFGWSYRDIFRQTPAAFIPDDHDVYHGNLWGAGGRRAPTELGWGYPSQDDGGYKMPAEWVSPRDKRIELPSRHDDR
jgi:alkaline phosphatase D